MAEDDRAVAEGSASWGLQGRMGLHLRGRGLQLSPYEESGDSSNVSRGRCVLAGPKMNPQDTSGCRQKPFPESQNHVAWRESKSRRPFFRNLLEQIQFLLGHASVQTTERYLGCKQNLGHPVNDLFDLRTAGQQQAKHVESDR